MEIFIIDSAPLQGLTEAIWRRSHSEIFGGIDRYHLPFSRIEKGEVRHRDLRELTSPFNEGIETVPQGIAKDGAEFGMVLEAVRGTGSNAMDLNLGCPFPPQIKRGRGTGLMRNPDALSEISEVMKRYSGEISFSLKMRLGVKEPSEWKDIIQLINGMPLTSVTIHPRTASQQYGGDLHLDEAGEFIKECSHPVIFNGDILCAEEIGKIRKRFPSIVGVMIGRGLLARPWIASEARGESWDSNRKIEGMEELHTRVLNHYEETLCGEKQILMKIKPYWEYAGIFLPPKLIKNIRKASSLQSYRTAVEKMLLELSSQHID